MQIFKSNNQLAKLVIHDHRFDQIELYTSKPGNNIFEGEHIDTITLTPREMIALGNRLMNEGRMLENAEKKEEDRLLALERDME